MLTERTQEQVQKADEAPAIDRRTMLTALAAGAAGVAAMAVPGVAMAATDAPVTVGTNSDASGADTGLIGRNLNAGGGRGVYGFSSTGDGVVGRSSSSGKSGVWALNTSPGGIGVTGDGIATGIHGRTSAGIGVHGESTTGTALLVSGKAVFSRSGVVSISRKKYSVTLRCPVV